MIQLAREYRRVVTYDELPLVMRQAILAAEDKNFHSHSGVDYGALPRVIQNVRGVVRLPGGTVHTLSGRDRWKAAHWPGPMDRGRTID